MVNRIDFFLLGLPLSHFATIMASQLHGTRRERQANHPSILRDLQYANNAWRPNLEKRPAFTLPRREQISEQMVDTHQLAANSARLAQRTPGTGHSRTLYREAVLQYVAVIQTQEIFTTDGTNDTEMKKVDERPSRHFACATDGIGRNPLLENLMLRARQQVGWDRSPKESQFRSRRRRQ